VASSVPTLFQRQFQLAPEVLGPNSAESVTVNVVRDLDVAQALAGNHPFPTRADGKLELGALALQASGGKKLAFHAGQGSVEFGFSASFRTGLGVFDRPADAVSALQLAETPGLDLAPGAGAASNRFAAMVMSYGASGSVSASHPIGAIGTANVSVRGSGDLLFGVIHRFDGSQGAADVLADTVRSWRLPRHVAKTDDLQPGTWLAAQADGSVAVTIGAQLGYDLNFVREARLLGVTRELGAKIDARLKASFGFSASGRYLVVLGRETDAPVVRLRIFKQSDHGFNFGLNLAVGVKAQVLPPAEGSGLVNSVFGIAADQVIRDLRLIGDWTDPTKDLGQTAARLLNSTGLDLLKRATGIDARQEFGRARQRVVDAFNKWDALPSPVSGALGNILQSASGDVLGGFQEFLKSVADGNADALASVLRNPEFAGTPVGKWLESISGGGVLGLVQQFELVQHAAKQALDALSGGVIKNIHDFVTERLDLGTLLKAVTQDDFDAVDGWLVKRLGDFFDKELHFADLKDVQDTIRTVMGKVPEIFERAVHAARNRYSMEFAASYRRSTSDTALLDAEFDLSVPEAGAMLRDVVADSRLDDLLLKAIEGVSLNRGILSHEIRRNTDIQFHMPFLDSQVEHVNRSLAKLTVEHNAGGLLAYQLDASDTVTAKNRSKSQLSVLGSLGTGNQSVAYQSIQVQKGMSVQDLRTRTRIFLRMMLPDMFPDAASLERFYASVVALGDAGINLQVAVPAAVLQAWLEPGDVQRGAMDVSRALQARLKQIVPMFYFQNPAHSEMNEAAAALLVWSAFVPSTSIQFDGRKIQRFNTDGDVFWNFQNGDLRRAMVSDSHTRDRLASSPFGPFSQSEIGKFQQISVNPTGDTLLKSLLITEAAIVRGAAEALKDINAALAAAPNSPSTAIRRLADFGAELTETFNRTLSVYSNESSRTINSMLLVEASRALGGAAAPRPVGMLNLVVLSEGHGFALSDYLEGKFPKENEIAMAQTLTNL
jgi:hypothetical protein